MLFALLSFVACEPEPGPGEVGYIECGETPLNEEFCTPISYCCEVLDTAGRLGCEYLAGGQAFTCEGLACEAGSDERIDAACDFPTEDTGEL